MLGTKKKWQKLQEAVQQNDAAAVAVAAAKLNPGEEEKYYDTCVTAARSGAGAALNALLKAGRGYNFTPRTFKEWDHNHYKVQDAKNRKLALQLVEEAYASPDPDTVLRVLYKNKENFLYNDRKDKYPGETCYLFPTDFLRQETPIEILHIFLKENARENFSDCVTMVGLLAPGTDKLEFILSLASGGDSYTLHQALATVNYRGDTDKAALLLKHGIGKAAAPPQQQPLKDRFNRLSADVLEEVKPPSAGSEQTVRYDFGTRQQIFLKDGATTHVVSFNSLDEGVEAAMRARLDDLAPAQSKPAPLKLRWTTGA